MALLEEVSTICKRLQQEDASAANNGSNIMDLLQSLLAKTNITVDILSKTKIGMLVRKFKKHCDPRVVTASTELFNRWKQLAFAESKSIQAKAEDTGSQSSHSRQLMNSASNSSASLDEYSRSSYRMGQIGDKVRDRVQELLLKAVNSVSFDDCELLVSPEEVAVRIEAAMYNKFKAANKEYKDKYRDIAFNLNDPNNPQINESLVAGNIEPERLIEMTHNEMASEQVKRKRKQEADYNVAAARSDIDKDLGATDTFKCGKCKKKKCRYFQKQTRSADEPMTTFIECLECGNKWKMN